MTKDIATEYESEFWTTIKSIKEQWSTGCNNV
jgi:hypothetical protein